MQILVFTTDLICSSQLEGAARAAGCSLESAPTIDRLLERAAALDRPLVVLDLNSRFDAAPLVGALRSGERPPVGIVAFGPHVHETRLVEARAAGCDQVLVRGAFYAQAGDLFRHFNQPTPPKIG